MIKIEKNNDIKVVTRGAYESFYEPLGYTIVRDGESTKNNESDKSDKIKEDKEVNKDTTTKPIKDDSKRK